MLNTCFYDLISHLTTFLPLKYRRSYNCYVSFSHIYLGLILVFFYQETMLFAKPSYDTHISMIGENRQLVTNEPVEFEK